MRASEAFASATVACAWATEASAAASAAFDLATASFNLAGSIWASNWPFFTRSFSCTSTLAKVPDCSLPTSTDLVGCKVPLAETVTTRLPVCAASAT